MGLWAKCPTSLSSIKVSDESLSLDETSCVRLATEIVLSQVTGNFIVIFHLARTYAQIFVNGHYLFLKAPSLSVPFLEAIMSAGRCRAYFRARLRASSFYRIWVLQHYVTHKNAKTNLVSLMLPSCRHESKVFGLSVKGNCPTSELRSYSICPFRRYKIIASMYTAAILK